MSFNVSELKIQSPLVLKDVVPSDRYERLTELHSIVSGIFGYAISHDTIGMLGYCVYVQMSYSIDTVSLLYAEVKPWHRGCGFGTKLIKKSIDLLKARGINLIDTEAIMGKDEESFLDGLGFDQKRNRYYMVYGLEAIINSKFLTGAEKVKSTLNCVKKLETLTDVQKKTFVKELSEKRKNLNIEALKKLPDTRFFVRDDKIVAVLCFVGDADKDLIQLDEYVSDLQGAAKSFPAMILSLMLEKIENKAKGRAVFFVNSEENRDAMEGGFGKPLKTVDTKVYRLAL